MKKWYEDKEQLVAAQGDVLFEVVEPGEVPKDAKPAKREVDGQLVVAHSETGHHHAFPDGAFVEMLTTSDPRVCYLRCAETAELLHHRSWDTHDPMEFGGGLCYRVRRQVEETPEGWQFVAD